MRRYALKPVRGAFVYLGGLFVLILSVVVVANLLPAFLYAREAAGPSSPPQAGARAQQATLRVAAAADLRTAFGEIIPRFEKESGAKVIPVFGSTGLLTRQAEQGAPFDVLFAANESYIADLAAKGRIVPGTRTLYAVGRLAIWTRAGKPRAATLADLAEPAFRRIAIANPEHAPYGAAAKQALERAGLWGRVQKRIVYGENIQQTLQYAQTGNADAGIVALSLAIGTKGGTYALVPDALHRPLRQATGVLTQSEEQALSRRFIAFVMSARGQAVMRRYGFTLPRNGKA